MAKKKVAVRSVEAQENTNGKLCRGVSPSKYRVLSGMVRRGETDWKTLEEAGVCESSRRGKTSGYLAEVRAKLGK